MRKKNPRMRVSSSINNLFISLEIRRMLSIYAANNVDTLLINFNVHTYLMSLY